MRTEMQAFSLHSTAYRLMAGLELKKVLGGGPKFMRNKNVGFSGLKWLTICGV